MFGFTAHVSTSRGDIGENALKRGNFQVLVVLGLLSIHV